MSKHDEEHYSIGTRLNYYDEKIYHMRRDIDKCLSLLEQLASVLGYEIVTVPPKPKETWTLRRVVNHGEVRYIPKDE